MIGIYMITNKLDGRRYIGQSRDIYVRFCSHKSKSNSTLPVTCDIQKYGKENFVFSVLEECDVNELDDREKYWIKKLSPEYNKTSGGKGNDCSPSPIARAKISNSLKAYWKDMCTEERTRILNNLTGRPFGHPVSHETRMKLREKNLGKKQSAETINKRKQTFIDKKKNGYIQTNQGHCKKVVCIETGEVYNSVKEAAEHIGADPSGITSVLNGRQKTCRNYHFKLL